MNQEFIQNTAHQGHELLKAMHQVLSKWWGVAQSGRILDPMHVVIKYRETAVLCHQEADRIEAELKKVLAA
jgi:hypothetical protein